MKYANPFPGLRPFDARDSHLFFGREEVTEELVEKLYNERFIAVIGASGGGKSSLVRAGVLPFLYSSDVMSDTDTRWRVAIFRPGNTPMQALADALCKAGVCGSAREASPMQRDAVELVLRTSAAGLVDLACQSGLTSRERLLVVVDQFEDLLRFRRVFTHERVEGEATNFVQLMTGQTSGAPDDDVLAMVDRLSDVLKRKGTATTGPGEEDADLFVRLLLEVMRQEKAPVHVLLTLRSEYLGECTEFRGLFEAIVGGQYLLPPMTREQLSETIVRPAAVSGVSVTSRLLEQVLEDVADDVGQLPVFQHAMMRAWNFWTDDYRGSAALDLQHYEAAGGMAEALSRHADDVFNGLPSDKARRIAEKLFQRLAAKANAQNVMRCPAQVDELSAIVDAPEQEVVDVVDAFRREDRSFLMPPPELPLASDAVVDITHESLIRVWRRLGEWIEQESRSAQIYRRIAETATLYREGRTGLWHKPDLGIALAWRERNKPTFAWAQRYNPGFSSAMDFLDKSARMTRLRGLLLGLPWVLMGVGSIGFATAWMMGVIPGTAEDVVISSQHPNEREQQPVQGQPTAAAGNRVTPTAATLPERGGETQPVDETIVPSPAESGKKESEGTPGTAEAVLLEETEIAAFEPVPTEAEPERPQWPGGLLLGDPRGMLPARETRVSREPAQREPEAGDGSAAAANPSGSFDTGLKLTVTSGPLPHSSPPVGVVNAVSSRLELSDSGRGLNVTQRLRRWEEAIATAATVQEVNFATAKAEQLREIVSTSATLFNDSDLVTCQKIKNLSPVNITESFTPGSIYMFARVRAPKSEMLTVEWRTTDGRSIGSSELKVEPNIRTGFRVFAWKNINRSGRYEVALFSQNRHLIGRREFSVE